MNNKLIKTNSLWYKIKTFFKNIFLKKTNMTEKKEKALQTEQVSSNIRFDHNLREKLNRKIIEGFSRKITLWTNRNK